MPYVGDDITAPSFGERLQHAWNAFRNKDPASNLLPGEQFLNEGSVSTYHPDRRRPLYFGTDQTIAVAIYNRIATDAASATIHHCRVDEDRKSVV